MAAWVPTVFVVPTGPTICFKDANLWADAVEMGSKLKEIRNGASHKVRMKLHVRGYLQIYIGQGYEN